MDSELLTWVLRTSLASTAAVVLVLATRPSCLRLLGARAALWPWLLVPLMMIAVSLPPRTETRLIASIPAAAVVDPTVLPYAEALVSPNPRREDAQFDADSKPPSVLWDRRDLERAALMLWLLGALMFALHLLREQRQFLRSLGRLSARGDGSFLAQTSAIGPAVIGLLRPRIVLPADFDERYDARQRHLILAHERFHLERGDLRLNLLVCALRCVYWFNPLMHLAARHLRFDQELSCDAAVLRHHPNSRRAYADAILNTQLADLGLPVGCYWQSSHPLKWRIIMLTQPNAGLTRLILGAALVITGSTLAAVSAWAALPARVLTEVAEAPAHSSPTTSTRVEPVRTVVAAQPVAEPVEPVNPAKPVEPMAAARPISAVPATPAAAAQPASSPMPASAARPATRGRPTPVATPIAEPVHAAQRSAAQSARPAIAFAGPARAPRVVAPAPMAGEIAASDGGADASSVIELPRLVKLSQPRFPQLARRKLPERGGDVIVRVDLDEQGSASNLAIEHSELGRAFENAAMSSVKRSEFAPARKDGEPVTCTALVTIRFQQDEAVDFSQLADFPVTLRGHPPRQNFEPRYVNWRPRQ